MPNELYLSELEETFRGLQAILEQMDQIAVRDKRGDFRVVPLEELQLTLQTKVSTRKKAQLLLTEIGYLRCNLFAEYYVRIERAEESDDLDKAVLLMREYAEIAIPFVQARKQQGLVRRIEGLLLRKNQPEEPDRIKDWQDQYETWSKKTESVASLLNDQKLKDEFSKLKKAFLFLYTYSFSVDNFPPLRNRRSDRLL